MDQVSKSAYLIGVVRDGAVGDGASEAVVASHLDELAALADTAGFSEAGRAVLPLRRVTPATFIGKGQAEDVGIVARGLGAKIIAIDEELTPAQVRNLEKVTELTVVDRAGIIIDIFAGRARSREARTQVELAQLEYLLPRLAGRWTHLSRQVGGGPGGTKGEGEKQIELDRRMIRHRIDRLRKQLKSIDSARTVQRRSRESTPQAALVGYTNVGKSSLFNRLTAADVVVENQLFATLDATVRRVDMPDGGSFLLKDTVGFIRKLPHHLVASFRSTFQEAAEADLMLIVIDIAHDAGQDQLATVETVLQEAGLEDRPRLLILNKIDSAPPGLVETYAGRSDVALVSAKTGEGIAELRDRIADSLLGAQRTETLVIPNDRGDLLAHAHRLGEVRNVEPDNGEIKMQLSARASTFDLLERLRNRRRGGEDDVSQERSA